MTQLSVVVPLKDERENLRPLWRQLTDALSPQGVDFEAIFVDDGSRDGSFRLLLELAATDERLKIIRLRRNFGQAAALQAGIDLSSGDVVVTMDGDLQNDPRDIPLLLAKLDDGYDVVLGERTVRQDHAILRRWPSLAANWLIRKATKVPFRDFGCTLRALRRDVAVALPLYGDMHRFVPALAEQCGARITQIPVRHHPRRAGSTKYGLSRTSRVILDLITVQFLGRYLTRPMHLFGLIGLTMMGLAVTSLASATILNWTNGTNFAGSPLVFLALMLGLGGIQLLSTGLLGELLARTYFESQGKTPYFIAETRNFEFLSEPKPATETALGGSEPQPRFIRYLVR